MACVCCRSCYNSDYLSDGKCLPLDAGAASPATAPEPASPGPVSPEAPPDFESPGAEAPPDFESPGSQPPPPDEHRKFPLPIDEPYCVANPWDPNSREGHYYNSTKNGCKTCSPDGAACTECYDYNFSLVNGTCVPW